MSIPIAVGAIVDQQNLGMLAATGSFTALHVTSLNVRERMRVLPIVAAALSFGYRMGPPGPILVALAFGLFWRVAIVAVLGMLVSITLVDPGRAYWTVGAGVAVIGTLTGLLHRSARPQPAIPSTAELSCWTLLAVGRLGAR